jgi:peptidoglycan/LPS O-acetylase OafA/YrhL
MTGTRRATLGRAVDLNHVAHIPPRKSVAPGEPLVAHDSLDRGQILTFITMWVVVVFIASALEPPPANPNAAPLLAAVLTTLFIAGMGATALLALTKSRSRTAAASLCTGAVALAMTIACPAVGHHHLAAWWFAQLAVVMAPIVWSFRQFQIARSRQL